MTRYIAVVGVDGAGKTTTAKALVDRIAADTGARVGYAGDEYLAVAPETDLLRGPLSGRGRPLVCRLALLCRWLAKRAVNLAGLYPVLKVLHLTLQERAARALARRYRLDVVVLDACALVSCLARLGNYSARSGSPQRLAAWLWGIEGRPRGAPRRLAAVVAAARGLRAVGADPLPAPDVVALLDVEPAEALRRIGARGQAPDRHENPFDLARARRDHQRTVAALEGGGSRAVAVDVTRRTAHETVAAVFDALRIEPVARRGEAPALRAGAERQGILRAMARFLAPRYLLGWLRGLHRGSWREAVFLLSRPGRRLAREGYSARVMNDIYRPPPRPTWAERAFSGYPLHVAVRGRLPRVRGRIRRLVARRLRAGGAGAPVRILSAPCGTAEDVLGALDGLRWRPGQVELVLADLDPTGELEREVVSRARALGAEVRFVRGDLTAEATRRRLKAEGPFDLVLFVGLSSWLPKPDLAAHLAFVASVVRPDGRVISDCFSVAAYARAGQHMGFHASYYAPEAYRRAWQRAGLDLAPDESPDTGPRGINHVLTLAPAATSGAGRRRRMA